jgi:hypothetical protein
MGGSEAIEADMSAPPALGPVGDSRRETLALTAVPFGALLLLLPVPLLETWPLTFPAAVEAWVDPAAASLADLGTPEN